LLIFGEKCPYCSKFRSPFDIIRRTGYTICFDCEQRHNEAVNLLTTRKFQGECSECGKTPEQLGSNGVMCVHFENGFYKAMCKPCDAIYVTKRRDLYAGTEFARQIGL